MEGQIRNRVRSNIFEGAAIKRLRRHSYPAIWADRILQRPDGIPDISREPEKPVERGMNAKHISGSHPQSGQEPTKVLRGEGVEAGDIPVA